MDSNDKSSAKKLNSHGSKVSEIGPFQADLNPQQSKQTFPSLGASSLNLNSEPGSTANLPTLAAAQARSMTRK